MHMKWSIVIGHRDRSFPEMTVQQTATYHVERSVKEFNHAAELVTIVLEPMLVMVTKVSSNRKSFSNLPFCLLQIVGMVYTAGCTDESYGSSRCPSKCNAGKSLGPYIGSSPLMLLGF